MYFCAVYKGRISFRERPQCIVSLRPLRNQADQRRQGRLVPHLT